MNKTLFELEEEDDIPHYEANHPKLQWLIILIPVIGAFALYTFIRIHNKRRKAKQLLDEEMVSIAPVPMTNIIPVPAPLFNHSNRTNNSRIYDSRTGERIYPLIRLSNNSNIGNATTFWPKFHHSTTETTTQQQNGQRGRGRRRRDRRTRSRRTPTPPPVYSISSPPKYEEVVALEAANETLAQVQTHISIAQQEHTNAT